MHPFLPLLVATLLEPLSRLRERGSAGRAAGWNRVQICNQFYSAAACKQQTRWIGFFADGKLKKAEVSGAPPQTIANAAVGRGGAWNRDGVILFGPNVYGPLVQVPATGARRSP